MARDARGESNSKTWIAARVAAAVHISIRVFAFCRVEMLSAFRNFSAGSGGMCVDGIHIQSQATRDSFLFFAGEDGGVDELLTRGEGEFHRASHSMLAYGSRGKGIGSNSRVDNQ